MKQLKTRSACPISNALDLFGDKWTLLIIRDMIFEGKSSYGECASSDEKIASNILADRLELLEHHGLVTKKVSLVNKAKFVYTLTEKAIDLLPVIVEMILWGSKYFENTSTNPKNLLAMLKKDKAGTIAVYTAKLKKEIKATSSKK
jgi:DNA-binding HxlR family transcriptional regulator